jgi:phospholipid/cholesterol/gamma-HCH transport system permease protein
VIRQPIEALGRRAVDLVEEFGKVSLIFTRGMLNVPLPPFRFRLIVQQMDFIGVQSLPIIVLAGAFTGAVFTLQSYQAFHLFGAEGLVGGTVGVALTRELGPTLTGLLVAGRAGSAMAAEISAMRVSEQIDALDAMAVDPINYLVKPRLIAAVVVTPILTGIFDLVGCLGAYAVAMGPLGMSYPDFMTRLQDWIDPFDIWSGLFKSVIFGLIIGTVACYKGFYAKGGAAGVGRATTSSVVVASVCILVANFFIAYFLPTEDVFDATLAGLMN